ncbi:MAG: helix-turn-helix domain-containing protein [Bacteroides graminisolvens]
MHEYCTQERNVAFYADKLCLSPRYLNTLVKNTSRQTVMEWLNQAVVIESKVLLKHSDLLVYQIADKLNFPNPSFFCKFFKKMTGMTPMEYQKS